MGDPIYAYKVFVADGHEEPVRGCEFASFDIQSLRKILAAGTARSVQNLVLGSTPSSSIIAPAVLIGELELSRIKSDGRRNRSSPDPRSGNGLGADVTFFALSSTFMSIGRNDPCPCGSGKKYKKCCLARDEAHRAQDGPRKEHFVTQLRPDVDEAVDRVLQRLDRGEGKLAEPEIAELLERFPGYHMTNYAMGVYHATVSKDPARAIPFFEKAIAIFPFFPEAHFNLGMAARQAFNIVKSIEALRAAERYSQGDEVARMARKEIDWFEKTLLQDGVFNSLDAFIENANLFDRAFQSLSDRRFSEAVELFNRVLKQNPKHVQSFGNLGLAYARLGRRADALTCLDCALELDPDYEPAILNRRAIAEMQEGTPFAPEVIRQVEFYGDRVRDKARQ